MLDGARLELGDNVTLAFAISAAAAAVVLGLVWLKTRNALARERVAFADFKARFPPTLIDIDGEVGRLRDEKDAIERGIVLASAQAETERTRERARFTAMQDELDREHEAKRARWDHRFVEAIGELERLQGEVEVLSDEAEMQSFGLYKPRYEFARAEEYKAQLDRIRDSQKQVLRNKAAALCRTTWEVRGNAAEGRRMVDRQIKLMLRAFNGECEAATANVSWKNVVTLRERIRKSFEAINKLGETIECEITMAFLRLRLDELDLAYEYAEKVHAEKEEQRELRDQMREEEKAIKEMEREKDDAEREGERHQKALEKARAEIERANQAERAVLDSKIAKLETLLAKAEERKQRAISQAELTKLGHVYILSNDALEPHRINLVNQRKEYFRVPLEKIVDLVTRHHGEIQLTRISEDAEYRKSLAIRAEREAMVAGKVAHASAVSRAEQVKARYDELKKATA
jgi:hypothetical protein